MFMDCIGYEGSMSACYQDLLFVGSYTISERNTVIVRLGPAFLNCVGDEGSITVH